MTPIEACKLVDDRPDEGVFRVHSEIFRSPEVFALEMQHIFEANWVYLGIEAQIPKIHDYYTTYIGRQPIIVSRGQDGQVRAFINSCRHRGALVCHLSMGNSAVHTCHYHGWVYASDGKNLDVKLKKQGGYSPAFEEESHDLTPVARFANYRGFLFGSLNPAVDTLEEYLGDAAMFLDLLVEQGSEGLEVLPGVVTYTYNGNWKMQVENTGDVYHFTSTHPSYLRILSKRQEKESMKSTYQGFKALELKRGAFCFKNGHSVMWGNNPTPEARPIFFDIDKIRERVDEVKLKWMFYVRNVNIFPNAQFAENASLQMRFIRPLAPDKTEVTTYCLAPKGESKQARQLRIRQYEEFFNPSGLATPDDAVTFEDCQLGPQSDAVTWHQGYMRGMKFRVWGANDEARELGVHPEHSVSGSFELGDETVFHGPYRRWLKSMRAAQ